MGPHDRPDPAEQPTAPRRSVPPAALPGSAAPLTGARQAQALRARLLAGHSATGTLECWCSEQGLGSPAAVHALHLAVQRDAPDSVRNALQIGAGTLLRYRRVRLMCGARVLSEADNWYLPGLLTARMNTILDSSDEPFGRVVGALGFQRQTLDDALYWPPRGTPGNGAILEIHALLRDRQQRPFSYVVETYLEQALA